VAVNRTTGRITIEANSDGARIYIGADLWMSDRAPRRGMRVEYSPLTLEARPETLRAVFSVAELSAEERSF
jgi:hypothetical protein